MQVHHLSRPARFRRPRRIGRGGKRGTYSGRGIKGQRARAGAKIRPAERDILKKIPKLRGYRFRPFRKKPVVVSLRAIEAHFPAGAIITPESLLEKKLIRRAKGKTPAVKVVGNDGKKSFSFRGVSTSRSGGASAARG